MSAATALAISDVLDERNRQDAYKLAGKFPHTPADEIFLDTYQDANAKLNMITEEVGEIAKVLCEALNDDEEPDLEQLYSEVVQVAALSVAWMEYLIRLRKSLQSRP